MIKIVLIFVAALFLYADTNNSISLKETKSTKTNQSKIDIEQARLDIKYINQKQNEIDEYLNKDILYAKYNNHQTYINLEKELIDATKEYNKAKTSLNHDKVAELEIKKRALQNQLDLLSDFRTPPFSKLTKPDDLKKEPVVDSPFSLINAFTYIKQLKIAKEEYANELDKLHQLLLKLEEKRTNLRSLQKIYGLEYQDKELKQLDQEIQEIQSSYDIAKTTNSLYNKKVDDAIRNVSALIKEQIKKLINVGLIILAIILLSYLFKLFARKTISDNQRYYMSHKVINFTNLSLIALVLLFYFLENATYLVTVLGFASAGIAIAMKDLFMSMLGWFVIIFGGSFHVGDRIKVYKGGKSYVGDIVDISFLRMTILEDITLTSYVENRRSGRIVFIPNNYVFTELLANYTHGKIKTVWDGIDITITFDSNHKKAQHIIKEIVKKYSKGYTDISRKNLNMLRNQYSLKNINVEPRIYTFIEKYGMVISCWYMTNSYAALTLRSNISAQIIDELSKENDIKIAYETHVVNMKRDIPLELPKDESEEESIS